MPTVELFLPAQLYPARHPVRWRAVAGLIALWIERACQRHALAELEDHMLRDIGITRVDAVRESGKPFWR